MRKWSVVFFFFFRNLNKSLPWILFTWVLLLFFAIVFVASFCFILEQDSLDEARQKIFSIREEYRNKLLEAERLKLEAQAAEEAASRVEPEKKVPAPDTHKKKKEKKK